MYIKIVIVLIISSTLSILSALTIEQSVSEVLSNNPVVQERLKNFRAIKQDLSIAESEYYPTLDLRASVGYSSAGDLYTANPRGVTDIEYTNYESSLILSQNIFNGFATTSKVDYEESRILAASYSYLEKSNDTAFKMVNAYMDVLKARALLKTARENVQINESIYQKVKVLYEAGLTTDSEVKKIQSTLSLAKSNMTVQQNNTLDSESTFRKVLGRMPNNDILEEPKLDIKMPQSAEKAAMYAIEHNPSILVSKYNIEGAQALWKQRKNGYYPKIDMELSQTYNDAEIPNNGFDQADDRFKARLVMTYNLFRGGADAAEVQKNVSKINQEIEIQRTLKREIIEGLDLSWNAYVMIGRQLVDLKEYNRYSEKTLELYKEEYDLGRRSLLDLLSAQSDAINSRAQIITSEYDRLFAKYRILDAMGLLVVGLLGDVDEYTSKVDLFVKNDTEDVLDEVPVYFDVDKDNISDSVDLCDNSLKENNIMPYGCKKINKDSDGDGVYDAVDLCPKTPIGAKVSPDGCALDTDKDTVIDLNDECPETPFGYKVDEKGCATKLNLGVNFVYYSAELTEDSNSAIKIFSDFLIKNKQYNVLIIGHTSSKGDAKLNMKLSQKRAKAVLNAIIAMGVNKKRLKSEGRGENEPIADNNTPEGRHLNRRVDIELIVNQDYLIEQNRLQNEADLKNGVKK